MTRSNYLRAVLVVTSCLAIYTSAFAQDFDIPAGGLENALSAYTTQTGLQLLYPDSLVRGAHTSGVKGDMAADTALVRLLKGTGLSLRRESNAIVIMRATPSESSNLSDTPIHLAAATAAAPALETVTVTSSKLGGGDVQSIPIAITALSQEQLTATQTAGGPDLIKQVPNMTFSKTNFTGYNIEIRGIGTQAISVTTDPAVAVAFNDTPFIRNHFFEQEFYDVASVEVARGPQGTLYGRNATAGVVNVISAKPTDQFEAMASADIGNYQNRRLEGMINVPIVDDRLDIRIAGEWTKRDGYSFNTLTDSAIDGRDLWSSRATIGWKPLSGVQSYLVWEHFSEDDNRLRSGKQLCQTDFGPGSIDGRAKPVGFGAPGFGSSAQYGDPGNFFTQGCKDVSLYSPNAFEAPIGFALPYVSGLADLGESLPINPYANTVQSTNLRDIQSTINPEYRAKNDTLEWNTDWQINPALIFTAATGYNNDFLWSTEDFNRFGATPGLFPYETGGSQGGNTAKFGVVPDPSGLQICNVGGQCGGIAVGQPCTMGHNCQAAGQFCDPQLGCSDRLIVEDLSTERAWQLSQEFRLASNFSGPLNFTAGANYLHYETIEKYYVFSNALTLISGGFVPGLNDSNGDLPLPTGYQYNVPGQQLNPDQGYVDPNPLSSLNDQGHNYFLSKNPYTLNSYAAFGEANYNVLSDLKLTAGLRWTDDQKHFLVIPSWVATQGYGYPITGVVNQQWDQWTGRAVATWTPKLDFTDQTLIYGSYSHGYKAGGANPPGAEFVASGVNPVHPLTFKPEFIEAFELGSKNALLDGAITLNGDVFYYNYTGYQISEIVDRTAINTNYDAHIEGTELESSWEPLPGLKFGFTGGFETSSIANGTEGVDLLDRTAGHPGWYVVKPFVTEASNCIFPDYVAKWIDFGSGTIGAQASSYCAAAYEFHLDPFTNLPYKANPIITQSGAPPETVNGTPLVDYPGFDPTTAPNNGQGFSKDLSGHQLPNAPHFTTSFTAEYTIPVTSDWAATLHGDFYFQSDSWARVFEDQIDRIHGYTNVNTALTFTNQNGWQVMGYVKNIFNVTAITGTFLNSDDTGLTTNVFLTDPRLYGVRITKNW